jgi:hypothetical protein
VSLATDRVAETDAEPETEERLVVEDLSPHEEVVFLLHTAAETEHALMVQYLYAAWSIDPEGARASWRPELLQIAREEMAHLASVQNLLRFVGGPLNLEREDVPFRTAWYPFPFELEPLSRGSLARYVAAEMPARPPIDRRLLARIRRDAGCHGRRQPLNRVGALYARLLELFQDRSNALAPFFRPGTASSGQARPEWWRADVGRGPLYLRTITSKEEALTLLEDVARQGEGYLAGGRTHFDTFLRMYDEWVAREVDRDEKHHDAGTRHAIYPVARNPYTGQDGEGSAITAPEAFAWAVCFNQHYRLLLVWLSHSLLTLDDAELARGLALRAFGEMLAIADIGQLLTHLPLARDRGRARAGAPFELPYTLALPDRPEDLWAMELDLVQQARARLAALPAVEGSDRIKASLGATLERAQRFIEHHGGRP